MKQSTTSKGLLFTIVGVQDFDSSGFQYNDLELIPERARVSAGANR